MRFRWLLLTACSSAPVLAPNQLTDNDVFGLQCDGTFVYYLERDISSPALRLMKVPIAGGTPSLLSPIPSPTMGTDLNIVPFIIDDATAFVAIDNTILSVPLAGGDASVLVRADSISAMALDDAALYWLDSVAGGPLMQVAKQGGTINTLVPGNASLSIGVHEFAVAQHTVYWPNSSRTTANPNDEVTSIPTTGGPATVWQTGQPFVAATATDGSSIYWITLGGGVSPTSGTVRSANIASPSTVTTIASNAPNAVAWLQFASGLLLWGDDEGLHGFASGALSTTTTSGVALFAASASRVFWVPTNHGGIFWSAR